MKHFNSWQNDPQYCLRGIIQMMKLKGKGKEVRGHIVKGRGITQTVLLSRFQLGCFSHYIADLIIWLLYTIPLLAESQA